MLVVFNLKQLPNAHESKLSVTSPVSLGFFGILGLDKVSGAVDPKVSSRLAALIRENEMYEIEVFGGENRVVSITVPQVYQQLEKEGLISL